MAHITASVLLVAVVASVSSLSVSAEAVYVSTAPVKSSLLSAAATTATAATATDTAAVAAAAVAAATAATSGTLSCAAPYQLISGHCIFLDDAMYGDWSTMRDICRVLGGDFISLNDANVLNEIFHYVHINGYRDVSYWVGASDEGEEGHWMWVDNINVHMNTPLWGDLVYHGVQEPTGGALENCAILNHHDDFYMHDVNCSEAYYILCEASPAGCEEACNEACNEAYYEACNEACNEAYYEACSKSCNITTSTVTTLECSFPYEDIGGRCVLVVSPSNGTWWEQRRLCELLNGHMLKLNDANLLGAIYDYIVAQGLGDYSVYIGASDNQQEGDWLWLDGDSVNMGTPFWGNIGFDFQEPSGGESENCGCLYSPDHFFIHDVSCDNLMGVICEY